MLATLGGLLALLLGLAILLLPLLTPELSRPRDAVWGALVLLLGLDLVTTADRLSGAPMLGVLCAALLIGRLGSEVAQARWRLLSPEERQEFRSAARWQRSLAQLGAAAGGLLGVGRDLLLSLQGTLTGALGGAPRPRSSGKRWVRRETPPAAAQEPSEAAAPPGDAAVPEPPVQEVSDFGGIEALLSGAPAPAEAAEDSGSTAAAPGTAAAAEPEPDPVDGAG